MSVRATSSIILAVILIAVVMGVAALMTFASPRAARIKETPGWTYSYSGTQSMKIIDLTGDKQKDIFLQNTQNVTVLDQQGKKIFEKEFPGGTIVSTMGDINGDNNEDIVVFSNTGEITALSNGNVLWTAPIENVLAPTRIALIRFGSGSQIIAGDLAGQLVSISREGKELWRASVGSSGDEGVRALDDAKNGDETILVAANHDGSIAAFDSQGNKLWSHNHGSELRRLRSYDLKGDKKSEILVGGENGQLIIYSSPEGLVVNMSSLGQVLTEIREAELDNDPSAMEFVVGGKKGGVWGIDADGKVLWSHTGTEKVTEITSADIDEDGSNEILIGDDSGRISILNGLKGDRIDVRNFPSSIQRLDMGKILGSDQVVVATGSDVRLIKLTKQNAPFFYTPLVAGLIVSFGIAVAAWFLATLPPKPTLQISIQNQTPEGLHTRKHMLHESIADVERLKQMGDMTPDAYLRRIRELREQMAETESLMLKNNIRFKVETFQCPKCGGSLPLGIDRCDYCGQTVIV